MHFSSLLMAGLLAVAADASFLARFQVPDHQAPIFADLTDRFDLDVWGTPLPGQVDIHVSGEMLNMIQAEGFAADILIDDVEQLIADEKVRLSNRRKDAGFFEEYQTYDSIVAFCEELRQEFPQLVSNFSVGTTYEGRDIYGLRITSGTGSNKPVFFFNGGIHAREWVSHSTVTFMINELVRGYGNDPSITRYLDGLEFIIIPVLNPDGYVYSMESERLWRKNREPNPGSNCIGTDLNRNWGYMWNTGGSSNIPCSDSYHGTGPFSCLESSAVEVLANNTNNIVAYIDFHAYSQLIMTPWGYTKDFPPNDAYIKEVGMKQKDAIEAVYGTVYQVGNIANIIYVASGSSADYFHGVHNVDLSYGYELRDLGRYGFLLPPDQIIPSGIETFEAIKVICEELV